MFKVKGIAKAVKEYNDLNKDGIYSPLYGRLMFDESDGQIWTDAFYSIGHNEWKAYHSPSIINLASRMMECGIFDINTKNVKAYIESHYDFRV